MTSLSEDAIRLIASDRVLAHKVLFKHRHSHAPAPFHPEIINAFHSNLPKVVTEAFRGAAKSTIGEETVIVSGALMEFNNCLLIGASYDRACERLESIKHEYETNEDLVQIFGQLRGQTTWATDKIVLSNGKVIQAKGAGQSLRGVKHHSWRPDFVFIDDLEDEESTRTPQARQEMMRWLYKTLMPALASGARIRFIGNRLDPDAVIVRIAKDPAWKHLSFPIVRLDLETGEEIPTWPDLFPLTRVHQIRDEYRRHGLMEDYNQEYLCEAEAPEAKIFRPEHFQSIVQPRVRTWEATYAMLDPAKSQGKRSATSAIAVWSWIQNRLVVWDCAIGQWMPDETIRRILEIDREYRPVIFGIEQDSLNQYILQPLRQAQAQTGQVIPIRALAAKAYTEGRGKIDFIQSLQPFFAGKEVIFAKDMPDLEAQFRSFPKGAIDGPNCLAYALKMRPGLVIYDEFNQMHVVPELGFSLQPLYLALNATRAYTTGILMQYDGNSLQVIADAVEEGEPSSSVAPLVRRMQVFAAGKTVRFIAPPQHLDMYQNVGLRAAVAHLPAELGVGGNPLIGRNEVRSLLRQQYRGRPAVQVAHEARWTLNAFAGGYCRQMSKGGNLNETPEDNVYATLMAGLESFASLMKAGTGFAENDSANLRRSADGRLYRSAMVDRR